MNIVGTIKKAENESYPVIKIKMDRNGNSRYVVSAFLFDKNSKAGIKKAKQLGCKEYRAKNYENMIVFQSYDPLNDLKRWIDESV